ncbi:acyltransferase family protein [Manganibacter manganicus]|uniref:Exopolysaccharide biosynthesis protein n=1 Tax=Manganibacter manganicus TaxID=1873176 RepID=A0A1V8RMC3_9HYPH|nr:acyltransferase [Pseudaminobacter manganicus]OQM74263.1 exopolysaccharide biosynthesis protein [Pseudaminobacter manganicus]
MKRLYGVQYLRAVAAIGVVVFHAMERTGGHFAIGAAGVDVFFVVSGFIMWVLAEARHPSPGTFLRDRIERIVPLYWAATAVMVAGGLAGLFPNMRLTAFHVFGSFAFIPHFSPSDGGLWPVLVQGWTLNYEMFFYVLFALALLLPAARRMAAMAAVLVGLVGAGLILDPEGAVPQTYTNPLLIEFLIGMGIGKLWLSGRMPAAVAGCGLLVGSAAGFAFVGVTYIGFNPYMLGPLAGMLLVGVLALEKAGRIRRFSVAAYLGDASYSIYLWHTMAISVVAKLAGMLALPTFATVFLAIGAGVTIGLACHAFMEKPITAFLKNRRRPARRAHSVAAT